MNPISNISVSLVLDTMRKMMLTLILVLILVLSSVLIYHIVKEESVDFNYPADAEENVFSDVSTGINNFLFDEDEEIEIGEMT